MVRKRPSGGSSAGCRYSLAFGAGLGFPGDVQLSWVDPHDVDDATVAGAVATLAAARAHDAPHEPRPTVTSFVAGLHHGFDGEPSDWALARDDAERVVGVLEVALPRWDNRHLGLLEITVDPTARRHGIGRWLFEVGVEKVRDEGRSLVLTETYDLPASVAFATAMKFERGQREVQRRQHLLTLDWAGLDRDWADLTAHASGYEVVRFPEAVPGELLADVVRLQEAINDAPIGDLEVEDEVFSPERIRGFETGQRLHDRRCYRLVARHRRTGELVGHTLVGVERQQPGFGKQYDTSVVRAHRGHRLGLLLKLGMLRWLRKTEPQLRVLDTWNADSNTHMVAINERLGYEVVGAVIEWQQHI